MRFGQVLRRVDAGGEEPCLQSHPTLQRDTSVVASRRCARHLSRTLLDVASWVALRADSAISWAALGWSNPPGTVVREYTVRML